MKKLFKKKVNNKRMNTKENIFGYIDIFDSNRIEGWAGSNEDKSIETSVCINEILIGSTKPSLVRVDVNSNEKYKYCKGFSLEFDLSSMVSALKNNNTENLVLTMAIDNQTLKQEFVFSKNGWLENLSKEYKREDFLEYLPLFGNGIEKSLNLTQLIDAFTDFEEYKLSKDLIFERSSLINEIILRDLIDEIEREKLYQLFLNNHDILLDIAKLLYTSENKNILSLVNQTLNTINHQDAKQIISNAISNKRNIFTTQEIEKKIKKDEQLFYLSNNPSEIIQVWKGFNAAERLDNAYSFMNLFVFLQEFDNLSKLNLSLNELNQIVSADEKLTIETLQQYLFANNNEWEGLLITLYFISSGVKIQHLVSLSMFLVYKLKNIGYLNSSALEWLINSKLFENNEIEDSVVDEFMQELRKTIDEKELWDDALIKKIYLGYTRRLLASNNSLFSDIYKMCINHYLLDNDFFIDKQLLTQHYIDGEYLLWIVMVEQSRKKAIALLGNINKVEELEYELNALEYLSPKIIKKVKFEIYSNILNLESDKLKLTNAAHGMFKVGGKYDSLLASTKLNDNTLYSYYESALINNTIKWQSESLNNYWYKQALTLRRSSEAERLSYLNDLYTNILNISDVNDEQLRLIRLFFSELLWCVENGLVLETFSINGANIETITTELIAINAEATEYSQIFSYYLKLSNSEISNNLLLEDLIDENIDFETKDRLKDILKVKENSKVKKEDAKKYIKQAMLYPYTLVMVYSCQAYIPTRQKAIRDTWLQRADELGIECVFVVGGSDVSKMKGDMMHLAVDDFYERLPQKSIEMFRFASEEFSYDRFMKIDDDCFVNIDAYFSDDALFNADYYGRYLQRNIGDMDRVWHQKKSKTIEAQNAIDLSSEPSYYADGSTGYVLSRLACEQLVGAYNDEKNKQLVNSSFMEDKLVGDLLVSKGFRVNSTNFTAVIYRKITPNTEATFWDYNIQPTCFNDIKVLHCETENTLTTIWKNFKKINIQSKKNYFSNRPINSFREWPAIPYVERLDVKNEELESSKHIGLLVCKNESLHLPALLEHHRRIGIEHFIYIDNASSDDSLDYMLGQKDVSIFVTTQEYKSHRYSVDWMEAALSNFCIGKWVLVIDADELFVYDDFENNKINVLTDYADINRYDSFLSPMVDMYNEREISKASIEGNTPYKVCNYFDNFTSMSILKENTFGPFSNSCVHYAGLRARIFGRYNQGPDVTYLNQKYCLFKYKPTHKFIEGIHFMGNNNPAPLRAALLHFKYHSGFYDKVHKQILSGQHWNGSQEYKRYLNKLENNDNLSLYDKEVSIKYENSDSLVKAGYMDKII